MTTTSSSRDWFGYHNDDKDSNYDKSNSGNEAQKSNDLTGPNCKSGACESIKTSDVTVSREMSTLGARTTLESYFVNRSLVINPSFINKFMGGLRTLISNAGRFKNNVTRRCFCPSYHHERQQRRRRHHSSDYKSARNPTMKLYQLAETLGKLDHLSIDVCNMAHLLNTLYIGYHRDQYNLIDWSQNLKNNPEYGLEKLRCDLSQVFQFRRTRQILQSFKKLVNSKSCSKSRSIKQESSSNSVEICSSLCKISNKFSHELKQERKKLSDMFF